MVSLNTALILKIDDSEIEIIIKCAVGPSVWFWVLKCFPVGCVCECTTVSMYHQSDAILSDYVAFYYEAKLKKSYRCLFWQ